MPLFNVEVYYGKKILTIVTVTADSAEEANMQAMKEINFKAK